MVKINKVYLKGQENVKGYNNPKKIIIHHPEFYGSIEELNSLMRGMGYCMIGYNYYVRKDGSVWQGRPVDVEGANCYGQNNSSIGVCFEGDYDRDKVMPKAQFNSGVELIKYLKETYNIKEVGPHKKYCNTDCPGMYFPIESMLNSINLTRNSLENLNYKGPDTNGSIINVSSYLNVRETPGGKIIGKLTNDDRVKVNLKYSTDSWYSIYFGSHGGFISKDYVKLDDLNKSSNTVLHGRVSSKIGLNVRNSNDEIIGALENGTSVIIDTEYSSSKQWSIRFGNHGGLISKKYIELI